MTVDSLPRDFKGIWIPRELWLDNRLNYFEKCLAAEIDSLDGPDHCYAGNDYFERFFNERERKISDAITKLKSLGIVEVVSFDGRSRILKSNLKTIYVKFDRADPLNSARLPRQNPLPSSREGFIEPENIIENIIEKVVCPPSPPVGFLVAEKVIKITTDGKEIEASLKELFCRSLKERKDWTTQEIEEAWKILIDCEGPVNDWYQFIGGTIKNIRNKEALEKMNTKAKKGPKQCGISTVPMESTIPVGRDITKLL